MKKKIILSLLFFCFVNANAAENNGRIPYTDQNAIQKIYQMMKDMHDVFTFYKIPYWIDGGTLLGAVRSYGLIKWDDDLDVCIEKIHEEEVLRLVPVLESLGYKIIKMPFGYKIYPIDGLIISERPWAYPFFDIFIVEKFNDKFYYTMFSKSAPHRNDGPTFMKSEEIFPLRKYMFGPLVVIGPNNPHNYLSNWYGADWETIAWRTYDHRTEKKIQREVMVLNDEDKQHAVPEKAMEQRFNVAVIKEWPVDFNK